MMGIDTSAVIDLFHGHEGIGRLLSACSRDIVLCRAMYLEFVLGVKPVEQHTLELLDTLFSEHLVLELTATVCKLATALRWQQQRKGKPSSVMDLVIASSYLAHGVHEIISNDKHFDAIPGLKRIGY
ncbi:hypothetical protein COY28_03720 [Candidatus Woesearchaeota archaeon CG_4_10_14_0_2_um_filter_57_5]|nr:MAG: hypothetical protein COV94_02945 [Candidatus Woesearchaeota archaeon CG11_big_fil_rev_8_21_14_0_20_57_5]PIZ53220.1 MAG: hypothetical protein COY28_03720 [Candidatus Woesearchaeota archaeon CG_4_10_14_0_2_um_filter_57_5]